MQNSVSDLPILGTVGLQPVLWKAPVVIPIYWSLPPPSWIKSNIEDASIGVPGVAGGGGTFRSSTSLVLLFF